MYEIRQSNSEEFCESRKITIFGQYNNDSFSHDFLTDN